jgi:hypothetical protein
MRQGYLVLSPDPVHEESALWTRSRVGER